MKLIAVPTTFALLCSACLLSAATLSEQSWPQWRGPHQNGVAPHSNPPTEWSETRNLKWKVEIPGEGDSTPIVWGDKVFILSVVETSQTTENTGAASATGIYQWKAWCLNRVTGQLMWQRVAHEGPPLDNPNEGRHTTFASYSPVTDGERLYVSFGSAGVYAYDFEGNLKWTYELQPAQSKKHGGEAGSLALHDGKLVINWDHPGNAFITALDAKSGKPLWKTDRNEKNSWFTPLIVEHQGVAQVVTTAASQIRSYDLKTGRQVWECKGLEGYSIPSPVAGHGMVFAMTGFAGENKLLALKLGHAGDVTGTEAIAWRHNKSTSYIASPLVYDNMLYFVGNNNNILSAVDAATGETLIDAERVAGLGEIYASPVGAGGRVYLASRNGRTAVIKKGAPLQLLAVNQLHDKFDASPAVVGDELFLRGSRYLFCIMEPR